MGQPPFQPPPQSPHGVPNPYNPYQQPAPPSMTAVPAPVPGPPPPNWAPSPLAPQPNTVGNPVGAIFLGLFASVVVSLLYSGVILATYKEQSTTTANLLYFAHALLNAAVVGLLVGQVGRGSNGAKIGGAVIAALGTFFGYANSIPLVFALEETPKAAFDLFGQEPFLPAKLWWQNNAGGVDWPNLLGLVLAAAAAWGLAHAVGNRRRRA